MNSPYVDTKVEFLYVKPNECVTVYIKNSLVENRWIQIEIRCRKDGTPEMFCDGLDVKSFDEWKSLKD